MGKKKNNPEYVVICREFHRRYFLTTKKFYQKYGAVMKKQVETMSFHGNRNIVELGAELDKERGKNERN